uniref:NADH dehydrogenase subunit 4L n=1 Tax=Bankia setacea TaxID=693219 RepID=UPI0020296F9F|nr:NADH dehydrogenase subunit 4L [Bankia setacea]UPX89077.1 NADH dehydrogenase subunit 4L [Bankia setacea]UPX89089.1 NADH dehydrogenase subunit 4L [Bankia setacea]UPX89101.1 NADH dehydrogenase subunit 4L [Bankia setacea]UPX89113.1 NADH dehydrogenase subunit 4L [Bankia setacea]UPX89125.1 NADH dehydrogenase subunit 4L [Bankia setacea]
MFWLVALSWGMSMVFLRHSDFLVILILLEMAVVSVFTGLVLYLSYVGNGFTSYALLTFLTMFVCESVVGLSLLVSATRNLEFISATSFCSLKY